MKKLRLNRQTIRALTAGDFANLAGGVTTNPPPSWQNTACWNSRCGTCPAAGSELANCSLGVAGCHTGHTCP